MAQDAISCCYDVDVDVADERSKVQDGAAIKLYTDQLYSVNR